VPSHCYIAGTVRKFLPTVFFVCIYVGFACLTFACSSGPEASSDPEAATGAANAPTTSTPNGDAGPNGAAEAGDAKMVDARDADASAEAEAAASTCPSPGPYVASTFENVEGTMPSPSGGTILDGTYFSTGEIQYWRPGTGAASGPSPGDGVTLRISGTTWEVYENHSWETIHGARYNASSVASPYVTLSFECSDGHWYLFPADDPIGYTSVTNASGTELTLYLNITPSYQIRLRRQ
jgi:hypothetical protein